MRSLFFFLFLCITNNGLSQDPIRLSAEEGFYTQLMEISNPSSRQIDSIIQLSIAYNYVNQDTSLILGQRAVDLASQQQDKSIYAKALLELGDSYRIFKDLEEAEILLKEGKAIYEELGDDGQVATANNKLGALMKNKGKNESAIRYYIQALNTWEYLKDSQNIVKPYINIGAVFNSTNRSLKAIEYNEKALEIADDIGDDRAKSYVANNLGIIYNNLALKYIAQADTAIQNKSIYSDSASFYVQEALNRYKIALDLASQRNDKRSQVRFLGNMMDLKITSGDYHEAILLSKEVESLSNDIGATLSIIYNENNQARAYRKLGLFQTSKEHGLKALKMASAQQMEKEMALSNMELYQTYKETGEFSKALMSLEAYKAYVDKNGEIERNKAIAEVESRYQNVQKEKQILEQQNEILELESVKAKIEKQRNYIVGGAVLTGLLSFFGFQLFQIRKQRNEKIAFAEALIFAQEEERKRIAQDLHDGVGQSLLLIKKQLESTHTVTKENKNLITETLEEVRGISRDLHPFQLQKFGLTAAIGDVIEKVSQSSKLFITKDLQNIDGILSEKSEIHLYRVIQEALNNIVKHSQANAAKIELIKNAGQTIIRIQDNGIGFDHELNIAKSKSLGLRTMSERVSSIGGSLSIKKGEPGGTVIEVHLPG